MTKRYAPGLCRHSRLASYALIVPIAIFSAGYPLPSMGRDPTVEERLFATADASARAGRLEDAVPDLERVLKINPAHSGARYHLAIFKLSKKEYSAARKLLEGVGNDPEFGPKARAKLQELKMRAEQNELTRSVQIYLEAGAFPEALKECRKALSRSPEDPDLLFYGAFTAALVGERSYAEALVKKRATVSGLDSAELQKFLIGWFARDYAPREALEHLVGLTDRRFFVPPVRLVIRDLMKQLGLTDDYERFMISERDKPGIDKAALDRDLARFFIEQGQYQKCIALLEARPVESMEDNLLLIEVYTLAGRESHAMNLARTLLNTGREEDALRIGWLKAWLHMARVWGTPPSGVAESGDTYEAIVRDNVIHVLNEDKPEAEKAESLLVALRAAVILGLPDLIDPAIEQSMRLNLDEALTKEALETAEEMGIHSMSGRAVSFLEWVLAQRPEDPACMRLLAENYCLIGRATESVILLENVVQKQPDSFKGFALLIDAMVSAGRGKEAHQRILERLKDPNLTGLPRRQLETKAFILAGSASANSSSSDTSDSTEAPSATGSETVSERDVPLSEMHPDYTRKNASGPANASSTSAPAGGKHGGNSSH
ncbi:MAG: tetratricopeptide repeat protein [Candidatus Riflebacteria bacterium]|nr:tetratricopeptide repeat protein [Candidatus Riflebacteria bacterium]